MRLAVQTLGTRGDVQPILALAVGLRSAGHDVVFAAAPQFRVWVERYGISFRELPSDLLDLMQTSDGRAAVSGKPAVVAKLRLLRAVGPGMRRLLEGQRKAADGAEAIVFHPKALGGRHIAEALRIAANRLRFGLDRLRLLVPRRRRRMDAAGASRSLSRGRAAAGLCRLRQHSLVRSAGHDRSCGRSARACRAARCSCGRVGRHGGAAASAARHDGF